MKQVRRFSSVLLIVCLLLSFATHVQASGISSNITSSLINSEFVSWDAGMLLYNCYGFAIGTNTGDYPGKHSYGQYNPEAGIYAMAALVLADLRALDNDCILQQTVRPTSVSGWDNVIAMRKETQRGLDNDFHFAMLTRNGEWLHKPGNTAVLKFKEAPSNDTIWMSEGVSPSGYVLELDVAYDSAIIYMSYKESHGTLMQAWTENDYHSGKVHYYEFEYICPDCGESMGTEWISRPCVGSYCIYPWSVEPEYEIS